MAKYMIYLTKYINPSLNFLLPEWQMILYLQGKMWSPHITRTVHAWLNLVLHDSISLLRISYNWAKYTLNLLKIDNWAEDSFDKWTKCTLLNIS